MANKLLTRFKGLPRWQKASLYTALGVLLYTLFGFLILPSAVRLVAEGQLREQLQREVQIGALRMNPYTLSATVREMVIFEPDGENRMAAFQELYVNLQAMSLFKWGLVCKEVRLDGFYGSLVLNKDHRWNFSDLIPAPRGPEASPATDESAESAPLRFSLNNVQLTGSEIHFQDHIREKTHHITGIDIALPFLSNLPAQIDIFVNPHFAATVNGTPFNLQGQVKPFAGSRETELTIDLEGIDLAAYMPYVPPEADFRVHTGLLDVKLAITYEAFQDGGHTFHTAGTIALRGLDLTDGADHPLVRLDQLKIDIGALEPLAGIVRIQEILLQRPSITVKRLPTEPVVRSGEGLPLRDVFRNIKLPPPIVKITQASVVEGQLRMLDLKPSAEMSAGENSADHIMVAIPSFSVANTQIDIDRQVVDVGA
ncbi:MAG: DUF748 domain-containing protein, partial [Desulfobacterales bacterium]